MKLFIPYIGAKLRLTDFWEFDLYREHRNETLIDRYFEGERSYGPGDKVLGTINFPKDTVLRVERIYIRNGQKDFDSITFRVLSFPDEPKPKKLRFWVKLHDANIIECELMDD